MKRTKSLLTIAITSLAMVFGACSNDEESLKSPELHENDGNPYAITLAQAQNQLNGILSGMGENVSRSGKRTIAKAYTSTIGANSRGENGLTVHVFNFDNGQGYAIMSGDQRTAPLSPSLIRAR